MSPPLAVLLSDDLLFASRITATARALGLAMRTERTLAAIVIPGEPQPVCIIVDLHLPGLLVADLAARAKEMGGCKIIGYGSHVAADLLRQAREGGCDLVLPRSKFVEVLAEELPKWYGLI